MVLPQESPSFSYSFCVLTPSILLWELETLRVPSLQPLCPQPPALPPSTLQSWALDTCLSLSPTLPPPRTHPIYPLV